MLGKSPHKDGYTNVRVGEMAKVKPEDWKLEKTNIGGLRSLGEL